MRAAMVLSGAASLVVFLGPLSRSMSDYFNGIYFITLFSIEALLAVGAVALVWVGIISLPKFEGWQRGRGIAKFTAFFIVMLAVVAIIALLMAFSGYLGMESGILLALCAGASGMLVYDIMFSTRQHVCKLQYQEVLSQIPSSTTS